MEKERVVTFLTFNGNAEEAMEFYASNLPGAKITKLVRYGNCPLAELCKTDGKASRKRVIQKDISV